MMYRLGEGAAGLGQLIKNYRVAYLERIRIAKENATATEKAVVEKIEDVVNSVEAESGVSQVRKIRQAKQIRKTRRLRREQPVRDNRERRYDQVRITSLLRRIHQRRVDPRLVALPRLGNKPEVMEQLVVELERVV